MIVSDWGAKIIVPCVITSNPWECHYEAAGVQPFSLQLFCQHTKRVVAADVCLWLYSSPCWGYVQQHGFFFFFNIHLKNKSVEQISLTTVSLTLDITHAA